MRVRAGPALARHEGQARPEPAVGQGPASLATDPPAEQLEEVESLAEFTRLARRRVRHRRTRTRWPTSTAWPRSAIEPAPRPPTRAAAIDARARTAPPIGLEPTRAEPSPPEPRRRARADGDREPPPAREPPRRGRGGRRSGARSPRRSGSTVDRLDHLMNLAGELVINKARFVEIARGLEELFRGSNAQAPGVRHRRSGSRASPAGWTASPRRAARSADGSVERWAGAGPPAPRELPARSRTSST